MFKKLLCLLSLLAAVSVTAYAGTGGGFDFYNYLKNPANKALDMNGYSIKTSSDISGLKQITWWDGTTSTSAFSGGSGVDLRPLNNTWTGTNDFQRPINFSSTVVMTDGIMALGDPMPPEVAPLFAPQRGGLTTYGTSDSKYPFLTCNSGTAASIVIANYGDKIGFQGNPMEYHLRVGTFTFTLPDVFNNSGVLSIWGQQGSTPTATQISVAFLTDSVDNPLAVARFTGYHIPANIPVVQIQTSTTSPAIMITENGGNRDLLIGFQDYFGVGQPYPGIYVPDNESLIIQSAQPNAEIVVSPLTTNTNASGRLKLFGYDGSDLFNTLNQFNILTYKDSTYVINYSADGLSKPIKFTNSLTAIGGPVLSTNPLTVEFLSGSVPSDLETLLLNEGESIKGPLFSYNGSSTTWGAIFVQQTAEDNFPALAAMSYGVEDDDGVNTAPVLGVLRMSTQTAGVPIEERTNKGMLAAFGTVSSSNTMSIDASIYSNDSTCPYILGLGGNRLPDGASGVVTILSSTNVPFINMELTDGNGFQFTTDNFWGLAPAYMPVIRPLGSIDSLIISSTKSWTSLSVTGGDGDSSYGGGQFEIIGWTGGLSASTLTSFQMRNDISSGGDVKISFSKMTGGSAGPISFITADSTSSLVTIGEVTGKEYVGMGVWDAGVSGYPTSNLVFSSSEPYVYLGYEDYTVSPMLRMGGADTTQKQIPVFSMASWGDGGLVGTPYNFSLYPSCDEDATVLVTNASDIILGSTGSIKFQVSNNVGYEFTSDNFGGLAPFYMPNLKFFGQTDLIVMSTQADTNFILSAGDMTNPNGESKLQLTGWHTSYSAANMGSFNMQYESSYGDHRMLINFRKLIGGVSAGPISFVSADSTSTLVTIGEEDGDYIGFGTFDPFGMLGYKSANIVMTSSEPFIIMNYGNYTAQPIMRLGGGDFYNEQNPIFALGSWGPGGAGVTGLTNIQLKPVNTSSSAYVQSNAETLVLYPNNDNAFAKGYVKITNNNDLLFASTGSAIILGSESYEAQPSVVFKGAYPTQEQMPVFTVQSWQSGGANPTYVALQAGTDAGWIGTDAKDLMLFANYDLGDTEGNVKLYPGTNLDVNRNAILNVSSITIPLDNFIANTGSHFNRLTIPYTSSGTFVQIGGDMPSILHGIYDQWNGLVVITSTKQTQGSAIVGVCSNEGQTGTFINYGDRTGWQDAAPVVEIARMSETDLGSDFTNRGYLLRMKTMNAGVSGEFKSADFYSNTYDNTVAVFDLYGTSIPVTTPVMRIHSSTSSLNIQADGKIQAQTGDFNTVYCSTIIGKSPITFLSPIVAPSLQMTTVSDFQVKTSTICEWFDRNPTGENESWEISVSSGGQRAVASCYSTGWIVVTFNGGRTWEERKPGNVVAGNWMAEISKNGRGIVAMKNNGRVYKSTDTYFETWTEIFPTGTPENKNWYGLAVSSDMAKILIGVYSGRLYYSQDTGAAFAEKRPSGNDVNEYWHAMDISLSGIILASTHWGSAGNGGVWRSVDDTASWTQVGTGIYGETGGYEWLHQSDDGSHAIFGQHYGRLKVSTDSCASSYEVQPAGAVDRAWLCTGISGNNSRFMAGQSGSGGQMYMSDDKGTTWATHTLTGDPRNFYNGDMDYSGNMAVVSVASKLFTGTNIDYTARINEAYNTSGRVGERNKWTEANSFTNIIYISSSINSIGGNVRGYYAQDFQLIRTTDTSVASGMYSCISGGYDNKAAGTWAVISGGQSNAITDSNGSNINGGISNTITNTSGGGNCTIGGGNGNQIGSQVYSTISGGYNNRNTAGNYGSIIGGSGNQIWNTYATVLGGRLNVSSGTYSVTAGRRAKATASGTFAFSDSTDADFFNNIEDSFAMRFANGYSLTGGTLSVSGIVASTGTFDTIYVSTIIGKSPITFKSPVVFSSGTVTFPDGSELSQYYKVTFSSYVIPNEESGTFVIPSSYTYQTITTDLPGGVTLTSVPSIANGTYIGQVIRLEGLPDSMNGHSISLSDDRDTAGTNMWLAGKTSIALDEGNVIQFHWTGSKWLEDYRSINYYTIP